MPRWSFRERPIDPPDFPAVPSFEALPRSEQLNIAEAVCRRPSYRDALVEALPESDGYDRWLARAIDVNVDDAEIGRRVREVILSYLARVPRFVATNLQRRSRDALEAL